MQSIAHTCLVLMLPPYCSALHGQDRIDIRMFILCRNMFVMVNRESSMVAPPPPPRASMRRSSNRIDGYPEVAPAVPARSRTNSMVQDDRVDLSDAKESMVLL